MGGVEGGRERERVRSNTFDTLPFRLESESESEGRERERGRSNTFDTLPFRLTKLIVHMGG